MPCGVGAEAHWNKLARRLADAHQPFWGNVCLTNAWRVEGVLPHLVATCYDFRIIALDRDDEARLTSWITATDKHVRSNGGGQALGAGESTIASILKKAGYATAGFGKWGLGDAGTTGVPEDHGFDTFFGYCHQVHAHTFYPEYLIRNSEKVPLKGNTGYFGKGETFSHTLIHQESMEITLPMMPGYKFAYPVRMEFGKKIPSPASK